MATAAHVVRAGSKVHSVPGICGATRQGLWLRRCRPARGALQKLYCWRLRFCCKRSYVCHGSVVVDALGACSGDCPRYWRKLRAISQPLAAHPSKGGDCCDAGGGRVVRHGFEHRAPPTLLRALVGSAMYSNAVSDALLSACSQHIHNVAASWRRNKEGAVIVVMQAADVGRTAKGIMPYRWRLRL